MPQVSLKILVKGVFHVLKSFGFLRGSSEVEKLHIYFWEKFCSIRNLFWYTRGGVTKKLVLITLKNNGINHSFSNCGTRTTSGTSQRS